MVAQTPPSIRMNAPRVWLSRYLIADSCSGDVFLWIMRGMKASRLSSIPTKTANQFVAHRANVVPVTIEEINRREWNFRKCIFYLEGERLLSF